MFPETDYQDEEFPPDLYVMRLQGPWRLAFVDSLQDCGTPDEIRLPCALPSSSTGKCALICLSRRFHKPTNLDREEQVILLLPPGYRAQRITCNDADRPDVRRLGDRAAVRINDILQDSNELQLWINADDAASRESFESPVLLGIMPDWDGSWWNALPT
jgi:hypothetical protein